MISIKLRNYRIFRHCAEVWEHWKRKHPQLVGTVIANHAKHFIFKPWYDAKKEWKLILEYSDLMKEFGMDITFENALILKKMKYKGKEVVNI